MRARCPKTGRGPRTQPPDSARGPSRLGSSSMRPPLRILLLLTGLLGTAAADPLHPHRVEVAPGIHVFESGRYGDVGLDGNSVAIVSKAGVLVFDANGTPAAAAAVLREIRALT